MTSDIELLKAKIRDVPDFPKPGIVFKDITTLLKDPSGLKRTSDLMAELVRRPQREQDPGHREPRVSSWAECWPTGSASGFVPVRKPGKLPARTRKASYSLEYGTDTLEVHEDALVPGERVLIVDDVIATGGTARAVAELAEGLGATVDAYAFLIELGFLNGREKLAGYDILSLIRY